MAKKTIVDWENLPKDEPVEVDGDLLNKEYVTVEEDWSSVKVDARVRCREQCSSMVVYRHFAEMKNGKVWVFPDGRTSWSNIKTHPLETYDITELVDE